MMKQIFTLYLTVLLVLIGLGGVNHTLACNNSYLSLDSVTSQGGNTYTIYFQFCVGGGYEPKAPVNDALEGADNSTMDFWFEIYTDTAGGKPKVTICPGGFPSTLNSGQNDSGCTNCQSAISTYNGILSNDPGCCPDPGGLCAIGCLIPGFCPGCTTPDGFPFPPCNFAPPATAYCPSCACSPQPCPNGDSTCVFYTSNHSPLYTGGSFPLCPETCPGAPGSGRFHEYTDIWSGSGRADAYCADMYLQVCGGLPDTVIARGLENESGIGGYCNDVDLKIPIDSLLANLPVVWTYITAQVNRKDLIDIEWGTASEINNDHFVIQKSFDGKTYTNIGLRDAKGDSKGHEKYELTDPNPVPGYQFYRVKQVDTDGRFGYSDVVSVFFDGELKTHLNYVSPIPTQDVATMSYYSDKATDYTLELIDIKGRVVYSQEVNARIGENLLELNLRNQKAGIYVAKLYNKFESISAKIIKE
ncbi:MAG: T9SS type A sorting domain-containing protein [Bacteroidia bacterium]|nr:T9SS type A sorting domain-containing protein [Bacteroidia bacterium]